MTKNVTVGTFWRYEGSKPEFAGEVVQVVLYQDFIDRYVVQLANGKCMVSVHADHLHEINAEESAADQN